MPVKTVQQRQTFEDLVAAKRREQSISMQNLIAAARPVTAPASQKQMPAAGIPTRGIDSPKPKQLAPAPSYANPTLAWSRKGTRTNSEATTAISTPRTRSHSSHTSSELYELAHDFCASTASSNAKVVTNQQLQEKMQRIGAGAASHPTVYGLERDHRALLHEHRVDLHTHHPSALKRIGDQSHMILDTPPATVKKTGAAVTPPPQSSARRKAHNLETQLYPSEGGMTGPILVPQDRLVSSGGDVIPARRHGNTVASPSDSPSKGDLFSKLTQERNDRMSIRTYEHPQTSLFGSEYPEPVRFHKKPAAPYSEESKIQHQLQMQLAALKAREKIAKRAKGALIALPLNVSSPEERYTRRHHNHRYMSHELAIGRTAFDIDPTVNQFQSSPLVSPIDNPSLKPAAGVRVGAGNLADCSESMHDLASLALGGGSLAIPVKIKRVAGAHVDRDTESDERLHWHMRKGTGSSPQSVPRNKVDNIASSSTGFIASSTAQDEIFRADKQKARPATSRNFSSFHTEEGGPIVHMTRPPTADAMNLRHSHADAGHSPHILVRSSLAITEYGLSNTQNERPDGGRKMVQGTSFRDSHIMSGASGIQGSEDSALNQLGWSEFAVGRRGVKQRSAAAVPNPPYGVDSGHASETFDDTRNKSSPKSVPFVSQMPAGRANSSAADEQKLCRYEGRELIAGKRRSYPQHPAVAHVSHIQHVTNALPIAAAKAAPSTDEIPYAIGGRVRPNSHRYFKELCAKHQGPHVQPSWWG